MPRSPWPKIGAGLPCHARETRYPRGIQSECPRGSAASADRNLPSSRRKRSCGRPSTSVTGTESKYSIASAGSSCIDSSVQVTPSSPHTRSIVNRTFSHKWHPDFEMSTTLASTLVTPTVCRHCMDVHANASLHGMDIAQPRVAAFFDIDNTIMRGASIYHLARGLFSRGILSASDLAKYAVAQGKFLTASSESLDDLSRITENALAFVKGRTVPDMNALCEEIFDDVMADKVWPGTVQLATTHKATGHQVWLVSAAPIELATIIAQRLGLDGAVATVSEIIDGVYTGRLASDPMHGAAKAAAVRELAEQHDIDLAHCFAYSDSQNDIPLLSSVGNPVAINPDNGLRSHARANAWPIYDFRREHLKARYAVPAGAAALALLGAGVGVAVSVVRHRRSTSA